MKQYDVFALLFVIACVQEISGKLYPFQIHRSALEGCHMNHPCPTTQCCKLDIDGQTGSCTVDFLSSSCKKQGDNFCTKDVQCQRDELCERSDAHTWGGCLHLDPPKLTSSRATRTVLAGTPVTFTASLTNITGAVYRFFKDGWEVAYSTSRNFTIQSVSSTDSGVYSVTVTARGAESQPGGNFSLYVADARPTSDAFSPAFFKKEVIKVSPRIYVATGFGLANSIMLVGTDGLVIVDVTESVQAAREVLQAFRNITDLPIKGVILTHNHADHVGGGTVFTEGVSSPPQVWAHVSIFEQLQRQVYTSGAYRARSFRQFGIFLPGDSLLRLGNNTEIGIVYPTNLLYGEQQNISIAGINMTLYHTPGETEDQIGVWLPDDKAFLCADNLYKRFPNLYSIRGTPRRDLLHWAASLDKVAALRPEVLLPQHARPIEGEDKVKAIITAYRDAIQFVHDQTLRYMNQGLGPDAIAARVHLPPHLAAHPYLQEFYGTVPWSVKGVFSGYLGWFSGDAVDLTPLTPAERALRLVKLGGGAGGAVESAEDALGDGDAQWALELSSAVLLVDNVTESVKDRAREVKVRALVEMAERQTSTNGRNYYLTSSMEATGELTIGGSSASQIRQLPMLQLFKTFQVRYNFEQCGVINTTVHFRFTDTGDDVTMTTRNGVVLVAGATPDTPPDMSVTWTSSAWREALINKFTGAMASLQSGELTVVPGDKVLQLFGLMRCFAE